jgi:outer membrane murein-binding lipoprotein Lpp
MTFYDSLEDDGSGGKLPPPGYTWADMGNGNNKLGNEKCDFFEATYEDGQGNEVTVMVNERAEGMCERVCKGKAGQQGKNKGRFVGGMQDAISSASIARKSLSLQKAQMAALRAQISELRLSGADLSSLALAECDPDEDSCKDGTPSVPGALTSIQGLNIAIVVLDGVLVAGNIVTEVLEGIKDVEEPPSQQDVAGFNGSSTGIPLAVAFHISKGVFGVLAGVKDILGSSVNIISVNLEITKVEECDHNIECRQEIRDKTDLLQADVDALQAATAALQKSANQTNAKLDEMKILLEAEFARIKELLLTPQGKRDGFSSK